MSLHKKLVEGIQVHCSRLLVEFTKVIYYLLCFLDRKCLVTLTSNHILCFVLFYHHFILKPNIINFHKTAKWFSWLDGFYHLTKPSTTTTIKFCLTKNSYSIQTFTLYKLEKYPYILFNRLEVEEILK